MLGRSMLGGLVDVASMQVSSIRGFGRGKPPSPDSPRGGIGTTFWVSFMIAAVVSGCTGAWRALLGRWTYQATKQSKAVSLVILAVIAATVVWTLILFVGRSM